MPIDFVELLHGEALNTMGTTERFLCKLFSSFWHLTQRQTLDKLRVSSIFFYLATPFSCLGIAFLFVKSNTIFRVDALLFCVAGLMVFFGLANYVSVCR